MRRTMLITASLILLAPSPAGADFPRDCRGGKPLQLVRQTDQVRILATRAEPAARTFYGCARPRGRLVRLHLDEDGSPAPEILRIAGYRVLTDQKRYTREPGATPSVGAIAYDLRPGRNASAQTGSLSLACTDCAPRVTDAVLKANGAFAAIFGDGREHRRVVRLGGRPASVTVLDQGAGIEPDSLALRGGIITWRNAGRERRARLR